jgi:hypothetical protein
MMRTPLALSAQDAVIVSDDLVIVGQELGGEPIRFAEEVVIEEKEVAIGASVEIMADSVNPHQVSEGILALVMSSLNSPVGMLLDENHLSLYVYVYLPFS